MRQDRRRQDLLFEAMAQARELRRRIRGIENTRKITHAMELVAGAKMRRAQASVLGTRRYAELAWEFLTAVRGQDAASHHPLLAGRHPVRRAVLLVVSGNRGLVGGFHEKIVAQVFRVLQVSPVPVAVVTVGKVARDLLHRRGVPIEADFLKKDLLDRPEDAAPVAQYLLSQFIAGAVDRVGVAFVDFLSALRLVPRVRTLLPVGERAPHGVTPQREGTFVAGPDLLFEPSPVAVLEAVVPNLLAIQVTQALLETTAAEHAARMVAMRSATENAEEIRDDLVLAYNDARKATITQEILEIVAGRWSTP